ncbi:hypothetical protein Ciccas_010419 [Cichlidogyrus casuarinus]|uniref:FYVE-type zinc finger domain-containing protein n=1 Tax=Cichlidogyrus casuarinus TaxID=1844966 RepID=A0ABD2PX35_9PLAT
MHSESSTPRSRFNKSTVSTNYQSQVLTDLELSADEETHLVKVLRRFDEQKRVEEDRVRRLRCQLVEVHRERLKTASNCEENCAHCGCKFIALLNPIKRCTACQRNVCGKCSFRHFTTDEVLCKICKVDS